MKVSLKYFGHLRDSLGKEETVDLFLDSDPHLLSEIFEELSKRKGEVFSKTIYESDGSLNRYVSIILNEKVVTSDRVKVENDSSILVIPFVDGG